MPVERTPCDMKKVVDRMLADQATYPNRDLEREFAEREAKRDRWIREWLKTFDEDGYPLHGYYDAVPPGAGLYTIPISCTYEQLAQFVLSERKRLGVV